MNKLAKKFICVLTSAVLALSCASCAFLAAAEDTVAINAVNFPDAVFRQVISENYDTGESAGYLTAAEIAAVTEMPLVYLASGSISDLTGIEYFTSLKSLYAGDLGVSKADFSALTKLQKLVINGNELTTLDVSKNTALTDLNCRGNTSLRTLTLSTSIKKLQCDECNLQTLFVSVCPNLTYLNCYGNQLKTIDLSKNTLLEELNCSENHLKQLDLSANTLLAGKITEYNIGRQTIDATASFSGQTLSVPVSFSDSSKITSSNIPNPNEVAEGEEDTYTGYNPSLSAFSFTDYDIILSGIDYKYDTGAADSEAMTVHINISKNFYRVRYFSDEEGSALVRLSYVNSSGSCSAPAFPQAPEGMVCVHWSGTASNVTADTDIYAVWSAAHTEIITGFANGTASVKCTVCGNTYEARFLDYINSRLGDGVYIPVLDVNKDGVINVRDYTMLYKGEY